MQITSSPISKAVLVGRIQSTLIEALSGLRPSHGRIAIGEVELGRFPEASFQARVAIVPQRAYLFAGTIGDNIRLGREGASDAEVGRAAFRAGVRLFADHLP